MPRSVNPGATDQSEYFYIVEDVGGTSPGEPKMGLTHSNLDSAYYVRTRTTPVQIGSLSTLAAVNTAHTDGGFKEVDATNLPGVYRFDPPDAAYASGAVEVIIGLKVAAAANAVARPIKVILGHPVDVRQWLGETPPATEQTGVPIVDTHYLAGTGFTPSTASLDDVYARLGAPTGVSISADIVAIPAAVEAAILDEGDATALLAAIAAKVEEFLINEGDAVATLAAIGTAVRTALATELARIDVTLSSRQATFTPSVSITFPTNFSTLNIDGSGKLILQPTQTGVTIPAVTTVTNGVTLADGAITEAKITTPAEASGRPTGILGMLRRLFEWGSNKRIRTRSTGVVVLRDEADSGALETQTQSTTGSVGSEVDTQTKGV